ncbi:MAG: hypothetical protein QM765_13255 [Myxococcales bacterium]
MVCLRCGSFVAGDGPVPGLALCTRCIEPEDAPAPVLLLAPPSTRRVRAGVLAGLCALLAVTVLPSLGGVQRTAAHAPLPMLAVLLGVALFLLSLVALVVMMWLPVSPEAWSEEVLEPLGLSPDRLPSGAFLALHVDGSPTGLELRTPIRPGLLATCDRGVAFLGASGTRVVIPASAMARVGKQTYAILFPPRLVLRIELADGRLHRFALLAGWRSRAETRALVGRLSAAAGRD